MKNCFSGLLQIGILCGVLAAYAASASAAEDCSSNRLGAFYSITDGDFTREIVLWRNGKVIAQQYPADALTVSWTRTHNGGLRQVRHFDAARRSIEFEAELNETVDARWQSHYQILNQEVIDSLSLIEREGEGCSELFKFEGDQSKLEWMSALQLPRRFSQSGYEIRLNRLELDDAQVAAFFDTREQYQTTDFADIGDSENDPFLQKMIKLGFIEHSH